MKLSSTYYSIVKSLYVIDIYIYSHMTTDAIFLSIKKSSCLPKTLYF